MIIPSSTKRKLKTRSSLREKQDHYVNSSRVSSRICHINITPSNKKCKLLYIGCNWKLYYTLVELLIYLITIIPIKSHLGKLSAIQGRWLREFQSWTSVWTESSARSMSPFLLLLKQKKSLGLSLSELTSLLTGEETWDQPAFMTLFLIPGLKTIFYLGCYLKVFWVFSPLSELSVITPLCGTLRSFTC